MRSVYWTSNVIMSVSYVFPTMQIPILWLQDFLCGTLSLKLFRPNLTNSSFNLPLHMLLQTAHYEIQ